MDLVRRYILVNNTLDRVCDISGEHRCKPISQYIDRYRGSRYTGRHIFRLLKPITDPIYSEKNFTTDKRGHRETNEFDSRIFDRYIDKFQYQQSTVVIDFNCTSVSGYRVFKAA